MDNERLERYGLADKRNIIPKHSNVKTNDHKPIERGANCMGFKVTRTKTSYLKSLDFLSPSTACIAQNLVVFQKSAAL